MAIIRITRKTSNAMSIIHHITGDGDTSYSPLVVVGRLVVCSVGVEWVSVLVDFVMMLGLLLLLSLA